jgi:molybdopterin-synthase adenylyltransferase
MNDDSRLMFLGATGLASLRGARAVVVGAGGSGSHLIQQLAHLGVGEIIAIDPDDLERSNVNRVVLSHYRAVGQAKADLIAYRLRKVGRVQGMVLRIEEPDAISALQSADICFSAVDHFGTRHIIEYFARMALVPVIDVGMQITVEGDDESRRVTSAGGQVVTSLPGGACFRCLGFLTDELLTRERNRYAGTQVEYEQQVISVNGLLASQAVTNMLGLFAGFVALSGLARYISYNALTGTMRPHPLLSGVDLNACPHYPLQDAGWSAR